MVVITPIVRDTVLGNMSEIARETDLRQSSHFSRAGCMLLRRPCSLEYSSRVMACAHALGVMNTKDMSLVSSEPALIHQLLVLAEHLERGKWLSASQLSKPQKQVAEVMAELLRGGYAVGTMQRSACGQLVEDATLFAVTAKGSELRQQLAEALAKDLLPQVGSAIDAPRPCLPC